MASFESLWLEEQARRQQHGPPEPSGMPETTASGFGQTLSDYGANLRGAVQPAIRAVGQGALPTVGMAGGYLLGGGAANPLLSTQTAFLGGAGGEAANQALGVTEPDIGQIALSGAAGPAGKLLGYGLRAASRVGMRNLPGAATALHELGAEEARQIPGRIGPSAGVPASMLFDQLKQPQYGTVMIDTPNLLSAVDRLASTERALAGGLRNKGLAKVATDLKMQIQNNGGKIDVGTFQKTLSRVGERTNFTAQGQSEERGAYKKLYQALEDDLDTAAASANPAMEPAQLLKAAQQAFKLERTSDEMAEIISKNIIPKKAAGEFEEINAAAMWRQIRGDKRFQQLPEDVKADVLDTLKRLNRIPARPPGAGVNAGAMRVLRGMGVAAGIGGFVGGEPGALAGAAIGAAGPVILAKSLETAPGRALVKMLVMNGNGEITSNGMALLAAYLTAQHAQPGTPMLQ